MARTESRLPPVPKTQRPEIGSEGRSTGSRVRELARDRLWPLALALTATAFVVVFVTSGRRYVQDSNFELDWDPVGLFSKYVSVWDGSRGLGDANPQFDIVLTSFLAVFRQVGLTAAMSQRVLHATLLAVGGVGAVAVLRTWVRPIGVAHVVTGLLFMFNPYTATFLFPSVLFLNFALAPWFLFMFLRGVRSTTRWAWAAGFALLVFAAGWSNVPGLIWALLPIVPAAIYLVHVERSTTWRNVGAWLFAAGSLTLLVSAAGLVKTAIGSSGLQTNLSESESPSAVSLASSWSESWRALGFWLSYWVNERGLAKPQTIDFFESVPVIAATFVAPIVALIALWRTRWLPRLMYGAIMFASIVFMVGAFPFDAPTPLGRLLLDAYDDFPPVYGFRNTYKAGAGLALGTAALVGVAAVAFVRWARRRGRAPLVLVAIAMCAVFVMASLPFWSGDVYGRPSLAAVPGYYRAAFRWLDAQPGNSRVLVLPGSTFTTYTWGSPGDDIVDALLTRPNVARTIRPRSAPESANLVDAIYDLVSGGAYRAGMLPPILRRIGVEYVLVRNDLDWQRTGAIRPAALQRVRKDPGLELVKTYGAPGENVLASGQHDAPAKLEHTLRPVEIFRVRHARDVVGLRPGGPQLLLSGDGYAWPALAADGALDSGDPVRYTGDLDSNAVRAALDDGSRVVVTDTNRRRQSAASAARADVNRTLSASETAPRGVQDLFGRRGSQTVLGYGDATSITASGALGFAVTDSRARPENAFDGDPTTAWLTAPYISKLGQKLRVAFRRPTLLRNAEITVANACCAGRVVSRATLLFSDGTAVPVDLSAGRVDAIFLPHRVRWVEIRIDETAGPGLRPIGFSEISFDGVSIHGYTQLPDDVFRAASTSPPLRAALAGAQITYQMEREQFGTSAEATLRRRFRTEGDRAFAVGGTLALTRSTPDALIDQLLGRAMGGIASSRDEGSLENTGANAVDGRADTSWRAPPNASSQLIVRFPEQDVQSVGVVIDDGATSSPLTSFRITIGDVTQDVTVDVPPECVGTTAAFCPTVARVTLPPTRASSLELDVTKAALRSNAFARRPVNVIEVQLNGQFNPVPAPDAAPAACVDIGATLDGTPLRAILGGSVDDLLQGRRVRFVSCGAATLVSGWHGFDGGASTQIDDVRVATPPSSTAPAAGAVPSVTVRGSDSTHLAVRADVPAGGAYLVTGKAYDERWTADANGRGLGDPVAVDTQAAWPLRRPGTTTVDMSFAPQRTFEVALGVSALGLLACVVLLVVRPRNRARVGAPPRRVRAAGVFIVAATAGAGFLVGGIPGLLIAVAGLVAARVYSAPFVVLASAAALTVAGVATIVEGEPHLAPGFASSRPVASAAGLAAGVLLLVALVELGRVRPVRDATRERGGRAAPDGSARDA